MKPHTRLLLTAAVFGIATIPFYFFKIDLSVQSFLYGGGHSWKYAAFPAAVLLYKYGAVPGLIAAVAASVVFALGFAYVGMLKYRKISIIVLLTMALGPGLFVNVLFKNYFGRPRPRDAAEFGGKWQYKLPLVPGKPGQGHSFPSGHASMGFVFLALYVYYRDKNKAASYCWLAGSSVFGAAIGAARMAQGGHFLSDVMWAAGITLITAEAVNSYVLPAIGVQGETKSKTRAFSILAVLCGAAVLFFMMSTPYYQEKTFKIQAGGLPFKFTADRGDVVFEKAGVNTVIVKTQIHGFGMPGSRVLSDTKGDNGFVSPVKGFFTELKAEYTVLLPDSAGPSEIDAAIGKGEITANVPGYVNGLSLYSGSGDIRAAVEMKKAGSISILAKNGGVQLRFEKEFYISKGFTMHIFAPYGETVFVNKSPAFGHLNEIAGEIDGSKEVLLRPVEKGGAVINIKAGKGFSMTGGELK